MCQEDFGPELLLTQKTMPFIFCLTNLEARIIGVADVIESMTAHHPCRAALDIEELGSGLEMTVFSTF